MKEKTLLITGINGYLGSKLAIELKSSYNVIGLEISLENLFRLDGQDFKVYLASSEGIFKVFEENHIDGIIHTATFYGRQNEGVNAIAQANIFIPFELLDIAISHKCNFFINTDTVLDRFVSTYALTKRHFQEWLYLRRNEIQVVNMQLEHFFGPNCTNTNFVTSMIERLKQNEIAIDLTPGEQKRNFVYIDDVVSAYQTILQSLEKIDRRYTNVQVSTSELISIREVMLFLKENIGSITQLNFGAVPYRENELMLSHTDNSTLTSLGWQPSYSIKKGILKTINC